MNSRKLAQPPGTPAPLSIPAGGDSKSTASSYIHSLAPKGIRPSFDSVHALAPLLEEMTQKMGGSIVITSEGAEIFSTPGYVPGTMTAEDGIIELDLGGRTAQLRFLRQTAAACPAFSRLVLLGQLSSGIAHDINNMLAAVLGNLGMMDQLEKMPEEEREETRKELITEISRAAEGIAALCRRVQTLGSSKGESRCVRISEAAADSLSLVRSFVTSARQEGTEITIENNVPENLYCMVVPSELQSCIINIVKNAVEHGFRGKERGKIVLDAFSEDGLVTISITNDGHVIPPRVLEALLKGPLVSECNTGLGLYSASERLRSSGAWLTFSSEPGATTFSITLIEAAGRH